jgi:hypothetical protein
VLLDIGVGCDNLVLWRKVGTLLELEVANGTGQGEVAVDTAKVDEATSGSDTVLLAYTNEMGVSNVIPMEIEGEFGNRLSS